MELTPFQPLKLLRHSEVVARALRGEPTFPISVEIDLSNQCNHHCAWCSYNGFRQENWITFPQPRMLTLLDELAACGVKSITFTGGGEPLVHQGAAAIFQHAADLGLEYGVVTNGRRLDGPVRDVLARSATFVRVSLDAGCSQTHQLIHATPTPEYERILKQIRDLRASADRARGLTDPPLTIGASMCIFDINRHEIVDAARRVRASGADYLEVRPVFPTEWRGGGFVNPLTAEHVADARRGLAAAQELVCEPAQPGGLAFRVIGMVQRFDQVHDKRKAYGACRIGPLTTVINADGHIYHCCVQRGMPAFQAASVLEAPFRDVWMNAAQRAMIAKIDVQACPPCRYDGYNQIIEQAFLGDVLHANFI